MCTHTGGDIRYRNSTSLQHLNDPLNRRMPSIDGSEGSRGIAPQLRNVLKTLSVHSYPEVPNPPQCKKRASVALVIRVQAHPDHWPTTRSTSSTQEPTDKPKSELIDDHFSQDWVSHGEPQVLFIKRATRKGDLWSGHVALPGGNLDPVDKSDEATAIRETVEEVGLDLTTDAISVGRLPVRISMNPGSNKP
jgi:8-oxo-dGTP pyrophosphatase MutT (NUDIX family)